MSSAVEVAKCKRWLSSARAGWIALGEGRMRKGLTPAGQRAVRALLSETARVHGLDANGELSFKGLYAIQNTAACTPQELHTDYYHPLVSHLAGTPRQPQSAVWAACHAHMWRTRDHGDILVQTGEVIFFLANFWHGGGASLSELPRFHGFHAPASVDVPTGVYT